MRKRQLYIDKYGPIVGPKLYHALQSQAAHAGVSARLRRKLTALKRGEMDAPVRRENLGLPLFPDTPGHDPDAVAPEHDTGVG